MAADCASAERNLGRSTVQNRDDSGGLVVEDVAVPRA